MNEAGVTIDLSLVHAPEEPDSPTGDSAIMERDSSNVEITMEDMSPVGGMAAADEIRLQALNS